MVHYIRLLRTPQVDLFQKNFLELSAVVAITTDLGDAYLLQDLELIARIASVNDPDIPLVQTTSLWKSGARVVKFALRCPKIAHKKTCLLHVTTKDTISDHASNTLPKVLDVWSAHFLLENKSRTNALVHRRLKLSPSICIQSWEETGDSIARHIWDAALACIMCFQDILIQTAATCPEPSGLEALLTKNVKGGLNILELGAGCGVVGIALAQILPKCNVLLTDLDAAQEILERNIEYARLAPTSTTRRAVLDWALPLDESILPKKIDLVLVADCIYNTDSIPSLVQMLEQIHRHSPQCKTFVARKPRHDSEMLFFTVMENTKIQLLEESKLSLPCLEANEDFTPPPVEFYLYGQR